MIEGRNFEHLEPSLNISGELQDHALEITKNAIREGAMASDTKWLKAQLSDWDSYILVIHQNLAEQGLPVDDRQRMLDAYHRQVFEDVIREREDS